MLESAQIELDCDLQQGFRPHKYPVRASMFSATLQSIARLLQQTIATQQQSLDIFIEDGSFHSIRLRLQLIIKDKRVMDNLFHIDNIAK